MDIERSYERRIETVEKEIGDKLFFLLWFMTMAQLVLIMWEWIHLVHPFHSLLGLSEKNEIRAIELSTTGYLVIQLAYMGKKEITRWVKKADTLLKPDEYIRRIRRGDTAILLWGVLYILGIICVALHIIEHMPAELSRTFIQVTTLYTCAFVSKTAFKSRAKVEVNPEHADVNEGIDTKVLEFIKQNSGAGIKECMEHSGMPRSSMGLVLRKLMNAGLITRTGSGRTVTYHAVHSVGNEKV